MLSHCLDTFCTINTPRSLHSGCSKIRCGTTWTTTPKQALYLWLHYLLFAIEQGKNGTCYFKAGGVAEGLRYLHNEEVIHFGLKCVRPYLISGIFVPYNRIVSEGWYFCFKRWKASACGLRNFAPHVHVDDYDFRKRACEGVRAMGDERATHSQFGSHTHRNKSRTSYQGN